MIRIGASQVPLTLGGFVVRCLVLGCLYRVEIVDRSSWTLGSLVSSVRAASESQQGTREDKGVYFPPMLGQTLPH